MAPVARRASADNCSTDEEMKIYISYMGLEDTRAGPEVVLPRYGRLSTLAVQVAARLLACMDVPLK